MLDPWIIEEIRRREDVRRREQEAPQIEMPLYDERCEERPSLHEEESNEPKRGVVVIDL